MSKKICAVGASILFYVGTFLLLFTITLEISADIRLFYYGFPMITACYFVIAGALFQRYLHLKRWNLCLYMNIIGYPLCWIILTIWKPMLWFNLGMLLLIIPVTAVLIGVWGGLLICFLCVRLFKRHPAEDKVAEPVLREEKLHRVSVIYLLSFISGPILFFVLLLFGLGLRLALAAVIFVIFFVLWIFFFPSCCQKAGRSMLRRKAEEGNLVFNYVFHSSDWQLSVDGRSGKLGLLLMWNPFHPYILSARRVTHVSVDDGNMGSSFLGGTCRVRLLVTIDGKKISLTTFSTNFNNRLGMDNELVRQGITEAETMREAILRSQESCV